MSIVWIGLLSYAMLYFTSRAGCIMGIPGIVMGVVVISAGTSVSPLYLPYISPTSAYISGARALDLGSRAMGIARPAWRGDLVRSK